MRKPFTSVFGPHLTSYVTLRQRLGLKFEGQTTTLYQFDQFLCAQEYTGLLTQDLALAFAMASPHLTPIGRARRYQTLCLFTHYLSAFVPETPLLDPRALTARSRPPIPFLFTDEQLGVLLRLAQTQPRHPMRRATLHAMLALVITTGLRRSEVVHLDRADVDLTTGVLYIRRTKFFKERLVPVHPTTLTVLTNYARVRDAAYPYPATPAFFLSLDRTRVAHETFAQGFRQLVGAMGFTGKETPHPTLHSLRHTFAVRRLETWYLEGQDVQALLPSLATYLGHAHYTDTAYYITATPRLMELAAARADMTWLLHTQPEVPA